MIGEKKARRSTWGRRKAILHVFKGRGGREILFRRGASGWISRRGREKKGGGTLFSPIFLVCGRKERKRKLPAL